MVAAVIRKLQLRRGPSAPASMPTAQVVDR
jgi:hypothetical protein